MAKKETYDKLKILHENHWKLDSFIQRMKTKDWELLLLNYDDKITFKGHVKQLVAKKLGYNVVEVSKSKRKQT